MVYCPACDEPYPDLAALRTHLQKAVSEGDKLHIEIVELEGWEETSSGTPETTGNTPPLETT